MLTVCHYTDKEQHLDIRVQRDGLVFARWSGAGDDQCLGVIPALSPLILSKRDIPDKDKIKVASCGRYVAVASSVEPSVVWLLQLPMAASVASQKRPTAAATPPSQTNSLMPPARCVGLRYAAAVPCVLDLEDPLNLQMLRGPNKRDLRQVRQVSFIKSCLDDESRPVDEVIMVVASSTTLRKIEIAFFCLRIVQGPFQSFLFTGNTVIPPKSVLTFPFAGDSPHFWMETAFAPCGLPGSRVSPVVVCPTPSTLLVCVYRHRTQSATTLQSIAPRGMNYLEGRLIRSEDWRPIEDDLDEQNMQFTEFQMDLTTSMMCSASIDDSRVPGYRLAHLRVDREETRQVAQILSDVATYWTPTDESPVLSGQPGDIELLLDSWPHWSFLSELPGRAKRTLWGLRHDPFTTRQDVSWDSAGWQCAFVPPPSHIATDEFFSRPFHKSCTSISVRLDELDTLTGELSTGRPLTFRFRLVDGALVSEALTKPDEMTIGLLSTIGSADVLYKTESVMDENIERVVSNDEEEETSTWRVAVENVVMPDTPIVLLKETPTRDSDDMIKTVGSWLARIGISRLDSGHLVDSVLAVPAKANELLTLIPRTKLDLLLPPPEAVCTHVTSYGALHVLLVSTSLDRSALLLRAFDNSQGAPAFATESDNFAKADPHRLVSLQMRLSITPAPILLAATEGARHCVLLRDGRIVIAVPWRAFVACPTNTWPSQFPSGMITGHVHWSETRFIGPSQVRVMCEVGPEVFNPQGTHCILSIEADGETRVSVIKCVEIAAGASVVGIMSETDSGILSRVSVTPQGTLAELSAIDIVVSEVVDVEDRLEVQTNDKVTLPIKASSDRCEIVVLRNSTILVCVGRQLFRFQLLRKTVSWFDLSDVIHEPFQVICFDHKDLLFRGVNSTFIFKEDDESLHPVYLTLPSHPGILGLVSRRTSLGCRALIVTSHVPLMGGLKEDIPITATLSSISQEEMLTGFKVEVPLPKTLILESAMLDQRRLVSVGITQVADTLRPTLIQTDLSQGGKVLSAMPFQPLTKTQQSGPSEFPIAVCTEQSTGLLAVGTARVVPTSEGGLLEGPGRCLIFRDKHGANQMSWTLQQPEVVYFQEDPEPTKLTDWPESLEGFYLRRVAHLSAMSFSDFSLSEPLQMLCYDDVNPSEIMVLVRRLRLLQPTVEWLPISNLTVSPNRSDQANTNESRKGFWNWGRSVLESMNSSNTRTSSVWLRIQNCMLPHAKKYFFDCVSEIRFQSPCHSVAFIPGKDKLLILCASSRFVTVADLNLVTFETRGLTSVPFMASPSCLRVMWPKVLIEERDKHVCHRCEKKQDIASSLRFFSPQGDGVSDDGQIVMGLDVILDQTAYLGESQLFGLEEGILVAGLTTLKSNQLILIHVPKLPDFTAKVCGRLDLPYADPLTMAVEKSIDIGFRLSFYDCLNGQLVGVSVTHFKWPLLFIWCDASLLRSCQPGPGEVLSNDLFEELTSAQHVLDWVSVLDMLDVTSDVSCNNRSKLRRTDSPTIQPEIPLPAEESSTEMEEESESSSSDSPALPARLAKIRMTSPTVIPKPRLEDDPTLCKILQPSVPPNLDRVFEQAVAMLNRLMSRRPKSGRETFSLQWLHSTLRKWSTSQLALCFPTSSAFRQLLLALTHISHLQIEHAYQSTSWTDHQDLLAKSAVYDEPLTYALKPVSGNQVCLGRPIGLLGMLSPSDIQQGLSVSDLGPAAAGSFKQPRVFYMVDLSQIVRAGGISMGKTFQFLPSMYSEMSWGNK